MSVAGERRDAGHGSSYANARRGSRSG
jgi:hypothetical protein